MTVKEHDMLQKSSESPKDAPQLLRVEHGFFGYSQEQDILKDVNLQLDAGQVLAVLGPNGIGKTTLLKCMIGLLPWRSGHTLLNGRDAHSINSKDLWSTISYIPQSHGFSFSYTGLEMVILGRSAHLGTFEQPKERELEMAEAMMERVGISHLAHKDCNQMSGGQLQMVLICRALINEPKIIVLDEPETGLDFRNQMLVLDMVERLAHEEGISAIMNTHYPANAMSVADQALMMDRQGNPLYGPIAEVLTEENITHSFGVQVAVNEFQHSQKTVKSVVPVSLIDLPTEKHTSTNNETTSSKFALSAKAEKTNNTQPEKGKWAALKRLTKRKRSFNEGTAAESAA